LRGNCRLEQPKVVVSIFGLMHQAEFWTGISPFALYFISLRIAISSIESLQNDTAGDDARVPEALYGLPCSYICLIKICIYTMY